MLLELWQKHYSQTAQQYAAPMPAKRSSLRSGWLFGRASRVIYGVRSLHRSRFLGRIYYETDA